MVRLHQWVLREVQEVGVCMVIHQSHHIPFCTFPHIIPSLHPFLPLPLSVSPSLLFFPLNDTFSTPLLLMCLFRLPSLLYPVSMEPSPLSLLMCMSHLFLLSPPLNGAIPTPLSLYLSLSHSHLLFLPLSPSHFTSPITPSFQPTSLAQSSSPMFIMYRDLL